ncbi:HEAT repeat domain-containing protein [Candidatus Harpocratesius sp.]
MFLTTYEKQWYNLPSFKQKIKEFIKKSNLDIFFEKNTSNQINNEKNPLILLEQLALLLVHPNPSIRNNVASFLHKCLPNRALQLYDAGNLINELPNSIKSKVIHQMTEHYKTANLSYLNFSTFWLGMYGTDDSLPLLIKNLSHPSIKIVKQVINAIGIFGSPRAIPYLLPLIHKYNDQSQIQRAVIEAIGILGQEGVGIQSLIHELYTQDTTNYQLLERYIKSFGARILKYVACEIEFEKNSFRKRLLQEFCDSIAQEFAIKTSKQYTILL